MNNCSTHLTSACLHYVDSNHNNNNSISSSSQTNNHYHHHYHNHHQQLYHHNHNQSHLSGINQSHSEGPLTTNRTRYYQERKMKRLNKSGTRTGSSSDSAITLDNLFEEECFSICEETSDVIDDFTQVIFNFACLALDKKEICEHPNGKRILEITKRYHVDNETDQRSLVSDSKSKSEENEADCQTYLENLIARLLDERAKKHWTNSCKSSKCLIREFGIPNELRAAVWWTLIKEKVQDEYDPLQLLQLATESSLKAAPNDPVIRQIELDVGRTMPTHPMFAAGGDGIPKLRRILIAYSVHVNPVVGYCQAMNFIAGLLLVVFDGNESNALMGLICIIDHYFPPHYYDQHLTGARADQLLLKDLLVDKLNKEQANQMLQQLSSSSSSSSTSSMPSSNISPVKYSTEEPLINEIVNSVALSWFLSLFHNAIPWQTRLQIMDCFWLEGVKVLFRFSLALLELSMPLLLDRTRGPGEVINSLKEKAKRCFDVASLKRSAFGPSMKIPKRRHLATRRAFYVKQLSDLDFRLKKVETTKEFWGRRNWQLFGNSSPPPTSTNNGTNGGRRTKNGPETVSTQSTVLSCNRAVAASFTQNASKGRDELKIIGHEEVKVIGLSSSSLTKYTSKTKHLSLLGVNNKGTKVIFCRESVKSEIKVSTTKGIRIETISVPFSAVAGFYCECREEAYIIGSQGVVTKVTLNVQTCAEEVMMEKKEDFQAYNLLCPQLETTVLFNKRSRVIAAAFDHRESFLWLCITRPTVDNLNSSTGSMVSNMSNNSHASRFQLAALDVHSLDIFSLMDIGSESVTRISCANGSIITCNQQSTGLSTVSMVSLGSSFTKQIIVEDDEIIDCLTQCVSNEENDVDRINNNSTHKSGHFVKLSRQVSTSAKTLIVALFKSGKLFCVETEGNCIRRKRSTLIHEPIDCLAKVLKVIQMNEDFIVTIAVPNSVNKIIKIKI